MFRVLSRQAKAWLKAPSEETLAPLVERASKAVRHVPVARRADWEKLVGGFAKKEAGARRRARVEGLVRACALFDAGIATKGAASTASSKPSPRESRGNALTWEAPVDRLNGLGAVARESLAKLGVTKVADLVWTLPVAWDDARTPLSPRAAIELAKREPMARMVVSAVVESASFVPMRGRRAVRVSVEGEGAAIVLWWYFAAHGVLTTARVGTSVLATGRLVLDEKGRARMAHPDLTKDETASRVVRPRYPRLGVPEGVLRRGIARAVEALDPLPDPIPPSIAAREAMPPVREVLTALHGADGAAPEVPGIPARRAGFERLAWAEAFTRVWERLAIERGTSARRARPLPIDRAAAARLRAELGFGLTDGQAKAIDAIAADLARPVPMRRLLLGDVGTGKTAVALAAAAQCVAAGAQVAILAPTSVLAEQYMDAAAPLARATGKPVALVIAGAPAAQRRRVEAALAGGDIAVAVGTHALLREGVTFARLGLVVVDEQHRLGVAQRLTLVGKGSSKSGEPATPHLLTLSATPIPRTLALALRGELRTSELAERPRGRPPVATELRPRRAWPELVSELRARCARGERAFVVAPRIEDAGDDESEVASATGLAADLASALAPYRITLVHGALSIDDKRQAMRAFRSGEAQVLVGTTVVEVGIDVPEATLMIVDGAERFGLAQLHQLRGRVGRGDRPGRCVLVHAEPLDDRAAARLDALVKLEKGIDVARADLALRGAGDLAGTRQSGVEEELLYLDPAAPPPWLARIEADVQTIREADPELARDEHRGLRLAMQRLAVAIAVREEAG